MRIIDALRRREIKKIYKPGTLVFWEGVIEPWWIVEWQPTNGEGAYWIVNAVGVN